MLPLIILCAFAQFTPDLAFFAGSTSTNSLSPTDIGSVRLWFDATVAASMETTTGGGTPTPDTGVVARWTDQSGNGYVITQGTAANQPHKFDNIQNGQSIVRFDGGDYIFTETDLPIAQNVSGFTIATVGKITTTATTNNFIQFARGTSATGPRGLLRANTVYEGGGRRLDTDATGIISDGVPETSSFHVIIFVANCSAGTAEILVDGTSVNGDQSFQTAGNTSNTLSLRTSVGSSLSFADFFNGDIGEITVFDKALSATEVAGLNNYLKAKWATP